MNMIIDIRDTKHKMQHTELQLQLQKDTYIQQLKVTMVYSFGMGANRTARLSSQPTSCLSEYKKTWD